MNHSLLHICKNFIGEVTDFFNEGQIRSLEEIEDHLKRVYNEFILEMVKTYFEILDKTLVEDKRGRKRKGLAIVNARVINARYTLGLVYLNLRGLILKIKRIKTMCIC